MGVFLLFKSQPPVMCSLTCLALLHIYDRRPWARWRRPWATRGILSLSFLGHGGHGLKHVLGHAVGHVRGGKVMGKVEEAKNEEEEAMDDFKDTFPLVLNHVGLGEGL